MDAPHNGDPFEVLMEKLLAKATTPLYEGCSSHYNKSWFNQLRKLVKKTPKVTYHFDYLVKLGK
jgi:hypothetical protein